jgi:hypothetical protein
LVSPSQEQDDEVDALFGEAVTDGPGWEDVEDHPRRADELVRALETTWKMIERCLQRWTPEMMYDRFTRERGGETQTFTRQWVIWRFISHDVHYGGEVSAILWRQRFGHVGLLATTRGSLQGSTTELTISSRSRSL